MPYIYSKVDDLEKSKMANSLSPATTPMPSSSSNRSAMSPTLNLQRAIAAVAHLAAVTVAFTGNIATAAERVECPTSINGRSIQLTNPPQGWKPFVPDSLYLHSAAPIDGPPEQLGALAEFTETRHGKEISYTFRLDSNFPDGKWIKCSYGVNGEITLSKRINDNVTQCTFAYRKGIKAGQHAIKISCE